MKKIRFGIVGTGNIAHRFANAIQNVEQAELTSVASRTRENADKFADEFGIPHRFGCYEAMAQSDNIDVAYIAVPHSGHMSCSCLMMSHGKNVICEKPLAVNEREVNQMLACAKQNGVFLMEAMWARLVPGTKKLLEIIAEGTLGEIKKVEGNFCYSLDESERNHHVMKVENGGGSLLDVGVYGLNFASWYLGKEVADLFACCEAFHGIDSHTTVLMKYADGSIATISSATMLRTPNEGAVYGTKGYAKLEHFYAPEKLELFYADGSTETIETPYEGNGFEEQIRHVCSCISAGLTESPINTHEQTRFITRQMDEIRRKIGIVYPQDKD